MEVKFQDIYGQRIYIHDNTASGNIRIQVKTHSDLNKCCMVPVEDLDIETDISLDLPRSRLLLEALKFMVAEELSE